MKAYLLHSDEQRALSNWASAHQLPSGEQPPADVQLLIQWDKVLDVPPVSCTVLNPTPAARMGMEERLYLLRLHGLPIGEDGGRWHRKYRIYLFQYEVIQVLRMVRSSVWRAKGTGKQVTWSTQSLPRNQYTSEVQKAIKLAIRALYGCGLDFGEVIIGVPAKGQRAVLQVNHAPKATGQIFQRFVQEFVKFPSKLKAPQAVSIGTDVEIILADANRHLVPASSFFTYRGIVGYDAIRNPRNPKEHPIMELRPRPSENPRKLYYNLYQAMRYAHKKLKGKGLMWLTGAMPLENWGIGGHLHFGRVPLQFQLVRVLDEYLALPFRILEDPRGIHRRPRYGRLGDVRVKKHGFEYRCLPSFIVSPRITLAVFVLAKFLAEHYQELPLVGLAYNAQWVQKYYRGNGAELYPLVRSRLNILENHPAFDQISAQVMPLFNRIRDGTPFDEHQDIRPQWKLL